MCRELDIAYDEFPIRYRIATIIDPSMARYGSLMSETDAKKFRELYEETCDLWRLIVKVRTLINPFEIGSTHRLPIRKYEVELIRRNAKKRRTPNDGKWRNSLGETWEEEDARLKN